MKLDFQRIGIRNFRHVGSLIIDLASYGPGLHFFHGINQTSIDKDSNGAGKSTIFAALCWCLYGRTPNGLRNPDIAPWNGDKNTCVSVRFTRDGKRHVIERTAHPNSVKHNNNVAGQDGIDRLLCMNFDLFTNTVLITQRQTLFLEKKPEDKMALFVAALDLNRWDVRSDLAAERTKLWDQHADQLMADIATGNELLTSWRGQLADLEQRSAGYNAEYAAGVRQATTERDALRARLEKVQRDYDAADLGYDGAQTEIVAIQRELTQLVVYYEALCVDRDKYNVTSEAAALEAERLSEELQSLSTATHCPTCGQALPRKTDRAKHQHELEAKIKDAKQRAEQQLPNALLSALADTNKQINTARHALGEFQAKSREHHDQLDRLKQAIADLKADERVLSDKVNAPATNPYAEQVNDLRKAIRTKDAGCNKMVDDLKNAISVAARCRYWIKAFKDVRLFILADVLSELEWVSAAMLEEAGLSGWQILYDIEKETKRGSIQRGLNAFIKSPYNAEPVKFECWSGGESQRLRLVGALALADVLLGYAGVDTNLEILDEPTTSLSVEGIDRVCEWFADRAYRLGRHVFYVDHRITASDSFTSVSTVVREPDGRITIEI